MLHELGRLRRLGRLVPAERPGLWLPLDDGLISGPENNLRDPHRLLRDIVEQVTAVLGFRGSLTLCRRELMGTPTVMNLSASTTMVEHTRKVPVGDVVDAVRAGADAIACHVNMASPFAGEQLEMLARRISDADSYGLPTVAIVYPRGRRADGTDENHLELRDQDPDAFAVLVRHCVRAAVDLGASVIKTVFTGSVESFRTVVESAMGVPVIIAGEQLVDEGDAIAKAQHAVRAGAAGIAFGRQICARPEPVPFVRKLRGALDDQWADMSRLSSGPPTSTSPGDRTIAVTSASPLVPGP